MFSVRWGGNFENLRLAPLVENVHVMYCNELEGPYKCEMDRAYYWSFYVLLIYGFLNFTGFFWGITMNYFWSLCYFL